MSGTLTLYPALIQNMSVGVHTDEILVRACEDVDCNVQLKGSPATISVTYTVNPNPALIDSDNDGVIDSEDAFPNDPNETLDTDNDGTGNNADADIDNDGVPNESDAFPLDNSEWLDSDGDGTGDNSDADRDNDGVNDEDDAFPDDITEWLDTDGDQVGNNADTDDDNDTYLDGDDAFPLNSTEWLDTDGDRIGNNADTDDDNDSYLDVDDAFPLDNTEWLDTDGDEIGNNADTDDDNDTYLDGDDAFPLDDSEWLDTDGDEIGNNADTDDDNDSYLDGDDAFPLDSSEWLDTDGDEIGNNADTDDDNDSYLDGDDAYPLDSNHWQKLLVLSDSLTSAHVWGASADIDTTVVNQCEVEGYEATLCPLTVFLQGSTTIPWSLTSSENWITLTSNGTGEQRIDLSVDYSQLTVGSHEATITYTDLYENQQMSISVLIDVSAPILSVSKDSVVIDNSQSWAINSGEFNVSLNTGSNEYSMQVENIFPLSSAVDLTSPSTLSSSEQALSYSLDPTKFSQGVFESVISLSVDVNGVEASAEIPFTVRASENILYASDIGLSFSEFNSVNHLSEDVTIYNSYGIEGIAWTALASEEWLNVTPSGISGGNLSISVDSTGLPADAFYSSEISISSAVSGIEREEIIRVGFWLSSGDPVASQSLDLDYDYMVVDPVRPYVYLLANSSAVIDIYNFHTLSKVKTLSPEKGGLSRLSISDDGDYLYSNSDIANEIIEINLQTEVVSTIELLEANNFASVYFRNNGYPLLAVDYGLFYNIKEREFVENDEFGGSFYNFVLATSGNGNRLCGIASGVSPFSLYCSELSFNTLSNSLLVVNDFNLRGPGGNAADVALNYDGSVIYTASGSPYNFPVFNWDSKSQVGSLAASNYPNAVEVASDGSLHGGISSSYGPKDVFIYEANGTLRMDAYASGYAENIESRQLGVSGDAGVTVVLTSDPKVVVMATYP